MSANVLAKQIPITSKNNVSSRFCRSVMSLNATTDNVINNNNNNNNDNNNNNNERGESSNGEDSVSEKWNHFISFSKYEKNKTVFTLL